MRRRPRSGRGPCLPSPASRSGALSELGADTIRKAAACTPIADLQIEYSLLSRGPEEDIIPTLRELGIGLSAYGVLSHGLLSRHWSPQRDLDAGDFRAHSPRFQGENLEHNLALVDRLKEIAKEHDATVARSRSPGWHSMARTSCRSSAPAAATASTRRSKRPT